ncbi:MAG: DNA-3-methyladenine glycosylase [Candidatus Eremiobacteraeota bacterium]|nr:DNA-3-methyladenine glycosylase [Candidatus Eremiobacteraeota bacterium]
MAARRGLEAQPLKARRFRRLRRVELPNDTIALARFLIGTVLVHDAPEGRVAGRIVETEAYLSHDPASHSFRGPTKRNASMFLGRGFAYVYRIYGTKLCLNVTSESPGIGAAVLLRALEPLEGVEIMQARREGAALRELARGPGRLTEALGVSADVDGADLCKRGTLWLAASLTSAGVIGRSTRIGLTKAAEDVLRFYERGNPYVSGPRWLSV